MSEELLIRLDQFLKLKNIVSSGGEAKIVIQMGHVKVNGVVETRRRKKIFKGDRVEFNGEEFVVSFPVD